MKRIERLVKAVTLLARAFNREVDDLLLESYRTGLEGVPIELVEQGVQQALQTAKFMPSPAEISGRVSLKQPGRRTCAGCGVTFSHGKSALRGWCKHCWKDIGGDAEDALMLDLRADEARKEITG